jgi:hypothetical protein
MFFILLGSNVFVGNILFTGIDPFLEVHHKQTSYSWFLPQIHQAIFSFEKSPWRHSKNLNKSTPLHGMMKVTSFGTKKF